MCLRVVGAGIFAHEVGAGEGSEEHQRRAEHHQQAEPAAGKPLAWSTAVPREVIPRVAAATSGGKLIDRAASTGIWKLDLFAGWRLDRGHRGALLKDTTGSDLVIGHLAIFEIE